MLRNIIGPIFNFRNCVFCCCFLFVFQKSSSFCRGNEIFKNKQTTKQKNGPVLTKKQKLDQFLTLQYKKYIYILERDIFISANGTYKTCVLKNLYFSPETNLQTK